ncbi:MAG: hypothetical protein K2X27_23070 [Candidatus Obscuribacterales bacterium]|nr:hypothetical protein [Candidatus Obscuribacterales bacterium]
MKKMIVLAIAALTVGFGAFGAKALADSKATAANSCCVEGAACCPGACCE